MTTLLTAEDQARHRLRVVGVVQGVGFRPYVHRLATGLELGGHVFNDTGGVVIEVEGAAWRIERFEARLVSEAPPLARIQDVTVEVLAPCGPTATGAIGPTGALGMTGALGTTGANGVTGFTILHSASTPSPLVAGPTSVSPDVAVCDDCLAEMWEPTDRRYRYPFVNCTNCGPRFTITTGLPYDRANTTMSGFPLCDACGADYRDPSNRRFHAEPLACDRCGPHLSFEDRSGSSVGDAAIASAQMAIARGEIVAVKGLGGYHLACDARSSPAVAELRRRKARLDKPFAVMVRDLDGAKRLAMLGDGEEALLTTAARPIVLLRRREGSPVSSLVAPGNPRIGVLLPYTPVHHLLFSPVPGSTAAAPDVLVMTSGNRSDEPICYDNADARRRLGTMADAWLDHDRPIHVPCDDSVVRVADGSVAQVADGGEELIRRSRGYAPLPIRLPFDVEPLLATGAELKNTFCLASGRQGWMSQHLGDMGSLETLAAFGRSTAQFAALYDIDPVVVAADAHPGYQTRRWAEERVDRPLVTVQHHHAHIASVMAECGVPGHDRVIGFAFDGTGYGSDGAVWGGEILIAGYDDFERAAHLRYTSLPGGDATIRKPYRAALAHLRSAGISWADDLAPVGAAAPGELAVLERQLERGVGCVPSSSMGRLFDAVSSLLGVRHVASYEAQAAIDLESVAEAGLRTARHYRFAVEGADIDPTPVLRAIVTDLRADTAVGPMAAGFHVAVAHLIADTAVGLVGQTGIDQVALSGGVFQNMLLVRLVRRLFAERGLQVLTNRLVPTNDGGLALGQAAIAGHRRQRAEDPLHLEVLPDEPADLADPAEVCITCSDQGRVVEIIALLDDGRAEVFVEGRREIVDVSLIVDVAIGDLLLTHAGVALTSLEKGVP